MKHLLNITIIVFVGIFFTSCQINKTYVKKYYEKLNNETVFVETANVASASGCVSKSQEMSEDGALCEMLLLRLPDIHSRYVGTGTFIKHEGKIRVLTAEHVCYPDEIPDELNQDGVTITVTKTSNITVRSQHYSSSAKIIKKDKNLDLCILEIEEEIKVKPAKIAKKSPKRGEYVHFAGAPYGMISESFLLTFEGTYSGDYSQAMVFSLPCAQGASGSSIRNRKNEIVSMVQRVHPGFNHICLGVTTEELRAFLLTKHPER